MAEPKLLMDALGNLRHVGNKNKLPLAEREIVDEVEQINLRNEFLRMREEWERLAPELERLQQATRQPVPENIRRNSYLH